MRILIIILTLAPFISLAQEINKGTNLTLQPYLISNDSFILDSSGYRGLKEIDTLYYPDKKIKAIGFYAVDKGGKSTYYRVGLWMEFYNNGEVKSIGNYNFHLLYGCCSAIPCTQLCPYKIGDWTYYYENGQIKARGAYKVDKIKVNTDVANQFTYKSIVTEEWLLYDIDGQTAKDKQKIISDLERLTL